MEDDSYTTTDRGKSKPSSAASHAGGHGHGPVSTSDLMSSAKVIAGAAKSALAHESDKVDKAQIAGAAADLLSGAKHYGKLDDKGFGKYVDKAEDYLHKYHSSHSPAGASPPSGSPTSGAAVHGGDGKPGHHGHSSSSGGGGGSGGYGDYIKMAQGFLKKDDHSHGGDGGGHGGGHGGGAGDYIKLAQGFLKKDDHSEGGGGGDHGHSGSGGAGDYIKLAQGFLKKH